ncbi:hypothetical protein HNP10_002448 [Aeromonas veronii]|uniref:DUF4297 family anti-phage-associated protein n=1 Tax=Aeromonas veronii TaxID=654 RepID=UPI001617CBD1|nr:DUF4297 family anti-phage-associated protein [Aeromonas veronii]MCS3833680.1 hypothetical protein [Aeromonas veronii]
MATREATDTITGYFYQFDKTILELLKQEDENTSVCIEGIEDIDITNISKSRTIQCKYYAKTTYNHSVIKEAIILMLRHFAENKMSKMIYYLYGHFSSGHEKLPRKITCEFLKENFLTYTKTNVDDNSNKSKTTTYVHNDLNLKDSDLNHFINRLIIDINAPSIDIQYESIINEIKKSLGVSPVEAELYHYNSALKLIKDLSIKQDRTERTITKSAFISKIKERDTLFNTWFIQKKGRTGYLKMIKSEMLSSRLNMEPYNRFFLIESHHEEHLATLKEVILLLAKKWSKISIREQKKFCPHIYIHGLSPERKISIKKSIYADGIVFIDPYPFKNADISHHHFYTPPSVENKIKFKFIDSLDDFEKLISKSKKTTEIYQFHLGSTFYSNDNHKHCRIKIEDIDYVKDLTK